MNNRTRRLQVFMRALSDSGTGSNITLDVASNIARIEEEHNAGSHSGLHAAVQLQEVAEE